MKRVHSPRFMHRRAGVWLALTACTLLAAGRRMLLATGRRIHNNPSPKSSVLVPLPPTAAPPPPFMWPPFPPPPFWPDKELVLLSAGRPCRASVRGNLAPAQVVTRSGAPQATKAAWLSDRWQAARDMSGTPIPGSHWVAIELAASCVAHEARLDWETACADAFDLQVAIAPGQWETLQVIGRNRTVGNQHIKDSLLLSSARAVELQKRSHQVPLEYRVFIREPATQWGVSLWRFELWGRCARESLVAARPMVTPDRSSPMPPVSTSTSRTASRAELAAGHGVEALCRSLKGTHRVLPGQSWGSLSEGQIAEWKAARCDRFFCRPSPMEALGQYRCIPLMLPGR